MRFFSKEKIAPRETSIPRLASEMQLNRSVDILENSHKAFTKVLEDFLSGIQQEKRQKP